MKTCPNGGKRCYRSARRARMSMASTGNRVRVYRCPSCGYLHVTRQAQP